MINPQRQQFVFFTIGLLFLTVLVRFFYWQVISVYFLNKNITVSTAEPFIISPLKGQIFDRLHFPLVINQPLFELSLYKPDMKVDLGQLTSQLIGSSTPSLNSLDIQNLNRFLSNDSQKWLTLRTKFTPEEKEKLSDPGLKFKFFPSRFYPNGISGQKVLEGLEKYYRQSLAGRSGYSWSSVDALGNINLSRVGWSLDAVNGRDLAVTLDRRLQFLAEEQIADGITRYRADSGSVIIMDSHRGGILAMAATEATDSSQKNIAIANLFEPGSIFKPLVMAAALNDGRINENYICRQCNRPHQIGQYSISNWDNSLHPDSNLYGIIKNSDNIGMSYIIDLLGRDRFLNYFQSLGLTARTGIDLPGEAFPLKKSYWPDIDLATASFGQGFAITQIQMLTAFNTLANNGRLVAPHLLDKNSVPAAPVFSQPTVDLMKKILQYSVENGVVARFKPKNLEVCAKSGTSEVAVKGGYSDSATIASYIGFVPCSQPRFTMIVTVNNPRTSPWGSSTAAPIWYEIAEKIDILL